MAKRDDLPLAASFADAGLERNTSNVFASPASSSVSTVPPLEVIDKIERLTFDAYGDRFGTRKVADRDPEGDGAWTANEDWPLIAIHAIITPDGKIMSFGTDERGMQGAQFIYDVYDVLTGEHTTLPNTTPTDFFCSVPVLVPGTGNILIAGGDARTEGNVNAGVKNVNIFDYRDMSVSPSQFGEMEFARWYVSAVTMGNGDVVLIGGRDENKRGVGTPEVFKAGEGWTTLTGAASSDIASKWWYPRAWVNTDGEIIVIESGGGVNQADIHLMTVEGTGSIQKIGALPFATSNSTPSVMYGEDLVLILANNGDLWSVDISDATPTYERVGTVGQARYEADMTVLADGTVAITGGSAVRNTLQGVDNSVAIWNPVDGSVTFGEDGDVARLYHSSTVLLIDGTLAVLGGGAPGPLTNTNGEFYSPGYLFNDGGDVARRPEIEEAPDRIWYGDGSFDITVTDAGAIERLTFVKNGSATHARNMETRFIELAFEVVDGTTLRVTPPTNENYMTPGYWMLFAIDGAGVPSIAATVGVGVSDSVVVGTDLNEYLEGTAGDDVMRGGNGRDTFDGREGNDRIFGEGGDYNQVNYDGFSGDYVVSRNADGSLTVTSALFGTDTLFDIDGFWFRDEEAWYAAEDLLVEGTIITGTAGDDVLFGTDGDDVISGGAGFDVMDGGRGDDTFIGRPGDFDQVNYDGFSTDYTFTRNPDGTVTAVSAAFGTDTLVDIFGIWFRDEEAWYEVDDLAGAPGGFTIIGTSEGEYLEGSAGDDIIEGRGGNDTLDGREGNDILRGQGGGYNQVNYDGFRSDFTFALNGDGSLTVTSALFGVDTLFDIDGFWFRDEEAWYSADQVLGLINADGVALGTDTNDRLATAEGDQTLFGGDGHDTLIGGAGRDSFHGGAGSDTVSYEGAGARVKADLLIASRNSGDARGDMFNSVEHLTGTDFGDVLGGDVRQNILSGGDGGDKLFGRNGDDRLFGDGGQDRLDGGGGQDFLFGGTGDDLLLGGASADYLTGGEGADTFALSHFTRKEGVMKRLDIITDFEADVDVLDLSRLDAMSGTGGNQAFVLNETGRFAGVAGDLISVQANGNTYLLADVNGDSQADLMITLLGEVDLSDMNLVL